MHTARCEVDRVHYVARLRGLALLAEDGAFEETDAAGSGTEATAPEETGTEATEPEQTLAEAPRPSRPPRPDRRDGIRG